jgi:hypothetical protein
MSVLLLVGSVSRSTGQTLLFSVHGGGWQVGGQFRQGPAVVGDIDDDGVPDLVVGYPELGRVVIFSGATGRRLLTLPPRPQPEAFFGTTLAGLGDVNGDGVPDLAVGAPGQDVRGLARGQVFVFSVSTAP